MRWAVCILEVRLGLSSEVVREVGMRGEGGGGKGRGRMRYLAGFQKAHRVERFLDVGDLVLQACAAALGVDFHELIFPGQTSR